MAGTPDVRGLGSGTTTPAAEPVTAASRAPRIRGPVRTHLAVLIAYLIAGGLFAFPRGTYDRRSTPERFNRPWAPDQRLSWMAEVIRYLPQYADEYRDKADYPLGINPIVVTPDGTGLWLGSNRGTDRTRLVRLDVATGA